jgi:RNA polymerase sigma-70 factor (ECF subfamily)
MLQTVLGLDAARIASAFLVAPAAMGQRLVRAKARIRDTGIPFEIPDPGDLGDRLGPVLDAVYAAYGAGWEDAAGVVPPRRGLATEAIWLARILVRLVPEESEARGLLSLLLHCEARRAARRSPDGAYVPLVEQEVSLWSRPMIDEAERELAEAAGRRTIGRFQLEAAIQSAHAQRAFTGQMDWEGIALLYEGLVRLSPSLGALVGRAAALSNTRGPECGLEALDAIESRTALNYQPFWAVRAHLLSRLGQTEAAREAYSQAIGLCEDPAVREFLIRGRGQLVSGRSL